MQTTAAALSAAVLPGPPPPSARAAAQEAELKKVAEDFAGWFLGEIFKGMDAGGLECDFGSGGSTEKIWKEMAYEEYGKAAARQQSGGLTELVYRSLSLRQQLLQGAAGPALTEEGAVDGETR